MFPVEEKRDYLKALRVAPNLIKQESDPVNFLSEEDLNPWTSAVSFVNNGDTGNNFFKSMAVTHGGDGQKDVSFSPWLS